MGVDISTDLLCAAEWALGVIISGRLERSNSHGGRYPTVDLVSGMQLFLSF